LRWICYSLFHKSVMFLFITANIYLFKWNISVMQLYNTNIIISFAAALKLICTLLLWTPGDHVMLKQSDYLILVFHNKIVFINNIFLPYCPNSLGPMCVRKRKDFFLKISAILINSCDSIGVNNRHAWFDSITSLGESCNGHCIYGFPVRSVG